MNRKAPSLEEVKQAIIPVLERGGARKAILFGSYARGDADEYSDMDLIIVAESKRPFVERMKDFWELWDVSPAHALDVLVYTPEEFQAMREEGNPFLHRALREGKTIYEARP